MSANIEGNMDSGVNDAINAGTETSNTPNVDSALEKEATSRENADSILGTSPPETNESEVDDNESILGKKPPEEDQEQEDSEENQDSGQQPIEYEDFTIPEDIQANEALLGTATDKFKELGLSQEQAQGIVDLSPEIAKTIQQAEYQKWHKKTLDWKNEVETDSEIGGANYNDTKAKIEKTLLQFDKGGELTDFLIETRAGNNPAMVKFLLNVANKTSEGKFEKGSTVPPKELSDAELFYPELAKRDAMQRRVQQ